MNFNTWLDEAISAWGQIVIYAACENNAELSGKTRSLDFRNVTKLSNLPTDSKGYEKKKQRLEGAIQQSRDSAMRHANNTLDGQWAIEIRLRAVTDMQKEWAKPFFTPTGFRLLSTVKRYLDMRKRTRATIENHRAVKETAIKTMATCDHVIERASLEAATAQIELSHVFGNEIESEVD